MTRKALILGLGALVFSLVACEDSTSASDSQRKGSFPAQGNPNFSCEVTEGVNEDGSKWAQVVVNIPNYMGEVEKLTTDEYGNGSQYIEETYFKLSGMEKRYMCLEYDEFVQEERTKGDKNITDYYCDDGVFYFVTEFEGARLDRLDARSQGYYERCEDYKREWEEGEYEEYQ